MPIIEYLDGFSDPEQKSHLPPEEAEIITQTGIILQPLIEGVKIFTGRRDLQSEAIPFLSQTVRLILSLARKQESLGNLPQTFEKYCLQEGDLCLCLFPSKYKSQYLLAIAAVRIHSQSSYGISLYPLAVFNPDKTLSQISPESLFTQYATIPAEKLVALAKIAI